MLLESQLFSVENLRVQRDFETVQCSVCDDKSQPAALGEVASQGHGQQWQCLCRVCATVCAVTLMSPHPASPEAVPNSKVLLRASVSKGEC